LHASGHGEHVSAYCACGEHRSVRARSIRQFVTFVTIRG
jgi:hypothetical protein